MLTVHLQVQTPVVLLEVLVEIVLHVGPSQRRVTGVQNPGDLQTIETQTLVWGKWPPFLLQHGEQKLFLILGVLVSDPPPDRPEAWSLQSNRSRGRNPRDQQSAAVWPSSSSSSSSSFRMEKQKNIQFQINVVLPSLVIIIKHQQHQEQPGETADTCRTGESETSRLRSS